MDIYLSIFKWVGRITTTFRVEVTMGGKEKNKIKEEIWGLGLYL